MELEHTVIILHRRRRLLKETYESESESEWDTDMVIILAILLCALLFTLGLNAFACRGRGFLNIFSNSPAAAEVAGLKKRDLRHLPMAVYGSGDDGSGSECPICLGEFVDGQTIRVLPKCGHGFHVECIDKWLISHASCPNCRISPLQSPPRISTQP
ncbi:hypothetical protein C2S51_034803 [Perilla frutescens var. frutescens]|nr:hypothetical protein C2S51_034803 [Perilla frutescens var. frutescens]